MDLIIFKHVKRNHSKERPFEQFAAEAVLTGTSAPSLRNQGYH